MLLSPNIFASKIKIYTTGDTRQLAPFSEEDEIKSHNQSLMKRLIDAGYPHEMLKEQFRMNKEISELLSDLYPEAISQGTHGTIDVKQ